eukprot:gene9166-10757_t
MSSEQVVHVVTTADFFRGARLGWICLFGLVGIFLRYLLNILFTRGFERDGFWSTLIINVLGCAAIGVVQVVAVEQKQISDDLRYGLMTGLFGGFTTFSGYCLESMLLFDRHQTRQTIYGVFYFILSPAIGLGVKPYSSNYGSKKSYRGGKSSYGRGGFRKKPTGTSTPSQIISLRNQNKENVFLKQTERSTE